jgi:hypothetical protein
MFHPNPLEESMATVIMMKNPQTGVIKKGIYGFSWTTFFFGGFPALFRGDIVVGICVMIASMLTLGVAGIIWAFIYNKRYTLGLIEKGYKFAGGEAENDLARSKLGIGHVDDMDTNPV